MDTLAGTSQGSLTSITGVGDSQAPIGGWTAANDSADVGHSGPVLVATGNVSLDPGLVTAANYEITVGPDGSSWLWDIGFGDIQGADGSLAASLTIRIVEPLGTESVSWGVMKLGARVAN